MTTSKKREKEDRASRFTWEPDHLVIEGQEDEKKDEKSAKEKK